MLKNIKSLSIIIPAYNEAENIAGTLHSVSAAAQAFSIPYEIIVVNDGSRDQTGTIVRQLESEIPHLRLVEHFPNRGYGGALKAGFSAAAMDWITFFPGDNQFEFAELPRLAELANQADIISGFRANRQDPFIRRVNAFGWNTLVRLLFGRLCRDIDCGFKLFRRSLLSKIPLDSNGAMIDTEFLAGAKARGYSIADVPITHRARTAGEPTGANIRVILKAFRDLLQFRLRLSRELKHLRQSSPKNKTSLL